MSIKEFSGKYRFLSNFWPAEVMWGKEKYPTVEHAYQAQKSLDFEEREKIRKASTPGQAKRLGKEVAFRKDWGSVRKGIMELLLKRKFSIPDLREKLLQTEDEELIEGNNWGDTFWGVCGGEGKNYLGKLLMGVRALLKSGRLRNEN